ncbi:MAG: hypothetical protein ACM3PX_03495 [Omnitrophica WOR_2 bacterium]
MHRYTLRHIALNTSRVLLLFVLLLIGSQSIKAQFYNGSQMPFGKSRVQYGDFLWTYYLLPEYDIYFYLNGKDLANYTARFVKENYPKMEEVLDNRYSEKIQFLIFNSLTDLKQSNLGLLSDQQYNIGGITYIIGNKIFVYFDGNYHNFETQLKAGMARVLINQTVYGGSVGRQITNSTVMSMPSWFIDGLVSYLAEDWNTDIDNYVREGVLSNRYRKINHLQGDDAIYAGHAIWKYIAEKYGIQTIPNIVYLARMSRNVETGFLYVLNISFKNLLKDWYAEMQSRYSLSADRNGIPEHNVKKKLKKDVVNDQVKIDPSGKYTAWVSNQSGLAKVWLYDNFKNKGKIIYRQGHRLDEKNDLSYPIIAFHPGGSVLSVITEKKGELVFNQIEIKNRKKTKQSIFGYQKILSMAYSPNGRDLVFSAIRRGQSDIFVFNVASASSQQITKDIFDDLNPTYLGANEIIFSSNRIKDTLTEEPKLNKPGLPATHDLFIYNLATKSDVLRRVTNTPNANEIQPMEYEQGFISYLSDQNGIYNRYIARLDSMITHVDTAQHYRYFTRNYLTTDYSRNIYSYYVSPRSGKMAMIMQKGQKWPIALSEKPPASTIQPLKAVNTLYMQDRMTAYEKQLQESAIIEPVRILPRFVNVYRDEPENTKENQNEQIPLAENPVSVDTTTDGFVPPKARNYNVEYSINELVNQLDFTFLSTSYQPFSGGTGPIYLTPGLNAFFKVGMTDLLEDYRIVAGVRLDFNLVNNEYVLSIANLKHRLDREIYFHRQSIEQAGQYSIVRYRIHELHYILKYPFNPILSLKGTASIRKDRAIFMSTDQFNLREPDINRYWVSGKLDLTYDATRSLGVNLYDGLRFKIFGEYYHQIEGDNRNTNMIVLGFDIRHYLPIHRTLIWANRFATSTSFGRSKLIYYMGGVDNWLMPKFTNEAPIDYSQNYAYQTLATNMRGFNQNVRNGNTFALINSELRFPVIKYLANRPLRSDFLNNFQLIGFGDFGTVWTGATPYSDENALFTRVIQTGSMKITIREQREPLVGGLGFGARSRILGYFVRADYAWGIEDMVIKKPIFYISLSLDF